MTTLDIDYSEIEHRALGWAIQVQAQTEAYMATIAELSEQAKDLLGRLRLVEFEFFQDGSQGYSRRPYSLSWHRMALSLVHDVGNNPADQIALDELLEEELVEVTQRRTAVTDGRRTEFLFAGKLIELTSTGRGAVCVAGDILPLYVWFTNREAIAATSGIPALLPQFDRFGGIMVRHSRPEDSVNPASRYLTPV